MAISKVIPDHAVKPIAWGFFDGDNEKSWFLTHFCRLQPVNPSPAKFLSIVKALHHESVSPSGMFGFHVTPFYGPPPMIIDWTSDWEGRGAE